MNIPRKRLTIRASRSGGPGGQNVNKVATKVEVRFRLEEADWLPLRVRSRMAKLFPRRLTHDGDFVVISSRYRSQARNIEDCLEKLGEMLRRAARRERRRVPTVPTRASRERRLQQKTRRSRLKRERSGQPDDE